MMSDKLDIKMYTKRPLDDSPSGEIQSWTSATTFC